MSRAAALLFLAPLAAQAQGQGPAVITGAVKSEFGDPLENANIYIAELAVSVGTNAQGR
jgi:hypothetical protein